MNTDKHRFIRHFSFVILSSFVIGHSSLGQSLPLWFTPSPDPNAGGTCIYGSTNPADLLSSSNAPTTYLLKQDAGTASQIFMTNVTPGCTWYFTATAYGADTNQVESARCNVLAVAVPKPPVSIRSKPH